VTLPTEHPAPAPRGRESAKIDPAVKRFTAAVQHGLLRMHVLRLGTTRGLSFERASYLLHVHAGYLPARIVDDDALRDLRTLFASPGGVTHAT
jgi:hypothetical protein